MSDRTAPAPYVGVSGFMSRAEVDAALAALPSGFKRTLMVGVLASSKTLCNIPNKYPLRYPKRDDIAGVFSDDPRCLNLVHVATDSEPSEIDGKRIPVAIDMMRAFRAGGPHCHGVQLNGATGRLNPEALREFRSYCPTASRVVLQVGPRWLENRALADDAFKSLILYGGSVTDILLDVSGGRGRAIDPEVAQALIVAARKSLAHWGMANKITFGIAGGLCAEAMPAIGRLLAEQAPLSIDAEGRLRDDADGGGNLDLDKVRAYLNAAHSYLCEPWSV